MGDLAYAAVTLGEGGKVILQYYDAIYPVILVKMILEPVPCLRVHREYGKGTGALRLLFWENEIIYLG